MMDTLRWNRIKFAERLAREMSRQGLTNAELARRTGLSAPAISSYINTGEIGRVPSLEAARRMATALRVPLDYLWPETPEEAGAYSDLQLHSLLEEIDRLSEQLCAADNPTEQESLSAGLEGLRAAMKARRQAAYSVIKLLSPEDNSRTGMLVIEVPPNISQPVGFRSGQSIWLVDTAGHERPPYLHLVEGKVQLKDSPDGALGSVFAELQEH